MSTQSHPADGLKRLAASAALIKASLCGEEGFASGQLLSPELRIRPDGDFEAWIEVGGRRVDLFEAWPNKFGRLAFGFACDHFKMLHEPYWQALARHAAQTGHAVVAMAPRPFGVDAQVQLTEASPERMTAPALMELCKRMATSPGWLMGALDELERGSIPTPPSSQSAPKPKM